MFIYPWRSSICIVGRGADCGGGGVAENVFVAPSEAVGAQLLPPGVLDEMPALGDHRGLLPAQRASLPLLHQLLEHINKPHWTHCEKLSR